MNQTAISKNYYAGVGSTGRRAACLSVVFLLLFLLAAGIFAAPSRTDNRVDDGAEVLTDATVSHIAEANTKLFALTGSEVAVVTVQNTGFESIESYAKTLFNDWKIGCAKLNNGVLLLVSVSRGEYFAVQGEGISDVFSSGKLKSYLNDYMSYSFEQGDIDTGVLKTFDAIVSHIESIYGIHLSDYDGTAYYSLSDLGGTASSGGATSDTRSLTKTVFSVVRTVFFILVGIIAAGVIFFVARAIILNKQEQEYQRRHPANDIPMDTGTLQFKRPNANNFANVKASVQNRRDMSRGNQQNRPYRPQGQPRPMHYQPDTNRQMPQNQAQYPSNRMRPDGQMPKNPQNRPVQPVNNRAMNMPPRRSAPRQDIQKQNSQGQDRNQNNRPRT